MSSAIEEGLQATLQTLTSFGLSELACQRHCVTVEDRRTRVTLDVSLLKTNTIVHFAGKTVQGLQEVVDNEWSLMILFSDGKGKNLGPIYYPLNNQAKSLDVVHGALLTIRETLNEQKQLDWIQPLWKRIA